MTVVVVPDLVTVSGETVVPSNFTVKAVPSTMLFGASATVKLNRYQLTAIR